jgi:hypothetical protein
LERNYDEPEVQRRNGNTQLPLSLYMDWSIYDGGHREGVKLADKAQLATQEEAVDELKQAIPGEISQAVAQIEAERETLRQLGESRHGGLQGRSRAPAGQSELGNRYCPAASASARQPDSSEPGPGGLGSCAWARARGAPQPRNELK